MAQIILPEGAAPATPASGNSVIYPKADGLWYSKDDAGTESIMSGAALAGSTTQTFSVAEATLSSHAARASQTRIKNDIINGQFRIAQAGTSFAAPASGAYDLDGWLSIKGPGGYVFTCAQVAGESAGKYARQVTITTAETVIAANDYVCDETKLEGYNVAKYVGNTFTIAFRAKVPVAGVHCVSFRNGVDRSYIAEINFPVANTWQDCSFTVVGGLPAGGTWNYTNGVGLRLIFTHAAGSTYQATAGSWQTGNYLGTANQINDCATVGNVWAIADVRIALGTFCPPDDASYDEDLRTCQRYYRTGTFYVPSTTAQNLGIIDMRATPTITGGGAGFDSTGTTKDNLIAFQTTGAATALTLVSRL